MLFNWSHKKPINPLPLSLSLSLSLILCLFLLLSNHCVFVWQKFDYVILYKFEVFCDTLTNTQHFLETNAAVKQVSASLNRQIKKKVLLKYLSEGWNLRGGEGLRVISLFFRLIFWIYGFWQYICFQENSNSGSQYWICQAQAI